MTLSKAITIRAAFASVKRQLAEAGFDINQIRSFSDLAPVLGGMLTEDIVEQATEILGNEEALEALLDLFSSAAKAGALTYLFQMPSDHVRQEDVENA